MAIVEPILGQQARNADHFLETGAAARCHNLPSAAWKTGALLQRRNKLAAMQRATAEMARSHAAWVIVEDARGLLN